MTLNACFIGTIVAWIFSVGASFAQAVVPTNTLRPGDIISVGDVRLSEVGMRGAYSDISQVLGFEAQRVLYRGRPIREGDVGAPALVERNEIVTLIYRTRTLNIATEGRALGRGATGEKVKVLNLASRNIVVGSISEAGEVIVSHD